MMKRLLAGGVLAGLTVAKKISQDNHFAQKRKFFWADGLKKTIKEALREWEDEVEYLGTPSKKSRS